MSSTKPNALRTIAEHELNACFGNLSPNTRDELATSLVRQWITSDGAAMVVTRDHHFRFNLSRLGDGNTQVVRKVEAGVFIEHLRRSRVIEDEIPRLLHELSVCQSTRCYTDYGEELQLRVDPAKAMFYIEFVPDAER